MSIIMNFRLALLSLLGIGLMARAAVFDQALTSSSQHLLEKDSVFFSFRRVQAPRRLSANGKQVLLSLAMPGHNRVALSLDRKRGQVVLETTVSGEIHQKELNTREIRSHSTIDSVLVELSQKNNIATVYVDCRLVGTITLPKSPVDMVDDFSELRVYRGRNIDVSIDASSNILDILEKLGCYNDIDTSEFQAQENDIYTYRRGDIPVVHEDEQASILVKSLTELIETIRELEVEIKTQREETALLRNALINCEACKPGRDFRLY